MSKVSIIILASGLSKRLACNKLFLPYQGLTFIEHTFRLVQQVSAVEKLLVISPENAAGVSVPEQIKVIFNHEAETGQSAAVRLGVSHATGDSYLFLPIDQPLLSAALLNRIVTASEEHRIVVPVDETGQVGSPASFGKRFRAELLQLTGDKGGKEIRDNNKSSWYCVNTTSRQLMDVDTQTDFRKLIALAAEDKKDGIVCGR